MTANIQDTDMFFVQRTSTRNYTNFKLNGDQLRNYIESTQLNLNNEVVGDVDNLKLEVIRINSELDLILGPDGAGGEAGLLFEIKEDFTNEILRLDDVDTGIKSDMGDLDIRIQRLEEFSSINAFYYLQDPSDYTSNILTGGMAFDSVVDKDITGIKLNASDLRDTEFSYVNISAGEKIEIIRFDSNNTVRKRLLFNIEDVTPPSPGVDYVTLVVTYLFSTSLQTLSLQEIIDSYDPDPSVPTSEYEMRVEVFPAFDASGTVDQSYVDNAIEKLEIDLQVEINDVRSISGVTSVKATDGSITVVSPTGDGRGNITISANPAIIPYNLLPAKTNQLGGVKVTTLSGSIHALVGINSSDKLVVQESTNNKRGVNFKGQCCVASGSVPNTSDYRQGQIIWHTGKKVLYIVT